MIQFGTILIQCRHKTGLSQKDVADRLGIAKSTYNDWESDKSIFKASYLPLLAKVFGVEITALFPPGLTVTLHQPNGAGNGVGLTFDARTLHEDLISALKRTIQLLEAENRELRDRPTGLA